MLEFPLFFLFIWVDEGAVLAQRSLIWDEYSEDLSWETILEVVFLHNLEFEESLFINWLRDIRGSDELRIHNWVKLDKGVV